jgi:SAM-dependent methyltransferase
MLDWLIEKTADMGELCDLGCGPGQVARYLRDHGAAVRGIDTSEGMLVQARRLNSDIHFMQGDMLALANIAEESFAGIAAFYCILHIPRPQVTDALREIRRVLRPNGVLLLTFHIGQEVRHLDEWWGHTVNLDFAFFEREEMKGYLRDAGYTLEEAIERDPYPEPVEVQTRRAYLFARK